MKPEVEETAFVYHGKHRVSITLIPNGLICWVGVRTLCPMVIFATLIRN